nr:hypothetical protein [Domibacillus indicus]
MPVQSWPMAYWPDGSIKWTGQSAVFKTAASEYQLEKSSGRQPADKEKMVTETESEIYISTGPLQVQVMKQGEEVIKSIKLNDKIIGENGKAVIVHETREQNEGTFIQKQRTLCSRVQRASIEQEGPIRCVIKIEGVHQEQLGHSAVWPFVIRLYAYKNMNSLRIVHTFFYDGDPNKDFIKGVGMTFSVPMSGEPWNRNVRFAGDEGIFSEPAQLLLTRRHRDAGGLFEKQIRGEKVNITGPLLENVRQNSIWNDFKISQTSSDTYFIKKRTKEGHAWLDAAQGSRAQGLMYAGSEENGLVIRFKNFWQKHPSSLEVNGLNQSAAALTAWFWAPDAEAMDLRHYTDETHVVSAYEGFDELRATPYGVANTSEIVIECFSQNPEHSFLMNTLNEWQQPQLLVCEPEYYHQNKSLGRWSLPDRENPKKVKIEEQLDRAIAFYQNEIEQRKWYGYWNYGDVMHTYDAVRHQWRYDLGGFAWQNTELVPNIWLWYAFLRSGRSDIFSMAEAMTRHTSEVDRYHFGEYKGLGSRHNVSHWGCGCKEARISMAGLHKYYYFLTTDERTRDLLESVKDADEAIASLDPMREFYPDDEYKTHARTGPDWAAFCSNWLFEWEHTENEMYEEKIKTGMNKLKSLPLRLLSGPTFGYDPKTSVLHHKGDGTAGSYHMTIAFGAPQVWMEMADTFEDKEWEAMLAEFGAFYVLSDEEKRNRTNGVLHNDFFPLPMLAAGMVAYAAAYKQDEQLAAKAWELLLTPAISEMQLPIISNKVKAWREMEEIPSITTNTASQWALNTIMALEWIGDSLPEVQLQEKTMPAIK